MQPQLLLVEDDRDLRILIKEILEISFQTEVRYATSGSDLLKLLQDNEFKIVISSYESKSRAQQLLLGQIQKSALNAVKFIFYIKELPFPLPDSDNLKVVMKPDFQSLINEVRTFNVLKERYSPA